MNQEFISKMTEARRLEKEALMSLLPKTTMAHIDIISGELKAIIKECVFASLTEQTKDNKKSAEKPEKKVRSVEIL